MSRVNRNQSILVFEHFFAVSSSHIYDRKSYRNPENGSRYSPRRGRTQEPEEPMEKEPEEEQEKEDLQEDAD